MKIFIIGCGRIFSKHIESIKALGKKKFEIVGIADLEKLKVKYFSKELKVPGFYNYIKGIKTTNPDIVSILTPSGSHAKNVLDVLRLKKNIIVEKPMCLKISDAKKIVNLSKIVKRKVFVVMQNKFNLPIMKMRQDIKKNKFGRIFHANILVHWNRNQSYYNQAQWRGTWKQDGGVISNQASHHLDLLRTIMGNPISVFAKNFKHMANIQAEDTSLVIIKFKSNKSAIIEATTAAQPFNIEGSISIFGTMGSAKIGGFALNKIEYYNVKKKIDINQYKTNPKNIYGFGHYEFYNHVYSSILNKKKSEFSCDRAVDTIRLINAIYKSNETKKEIFFNKDINITSKLLGN
jgi:predicted dehydrogenase